MLAGTPRISSPISGSGGGAVNQVSNVDGSLTIAPITGNVIASINQSHGNIWLVPQVFNRQNLTTNILPAVSLTNTTAALVGVPVQNSPSLFFSGTNFVSGASQVLTLKQTLLPASGASRFTFSWDGVIGASTTTGLMTLTQAGDLSVLRDFNAPNGNIIAALSLQTGNNGGTGGELIMNGGTTGQVSILAPASTSSYAITLPTAQGAAGSTLSNNGAGILSWVGLPTGTIGGSISTNQIAVGSGTNTIAGSSKLTWNGSLFDITDGSANDFLEINTSTRSGGMGDLDSSFNGTKMNWDDSAQTITLNASNLIITNPTVTIDALPYTFPASFGSAGSVLTDTSGAGALSWTAPHSTSPINGITIASVLARTTTGNIGGVYAVPMPNSGFYRFNVWLDVTAVTVGTVLITVNFTDFRSVSQTISFFPSGLTSASVATTGYYPMQAFTTYCKGGTNITVTATVTGTITYDAGLALEYIN